jgi:hypothetical protein
MTAILLHLFTKDQTWRKALKALIPLCVLISVSACSATPPSSNWKIYQNPRYGFTFPYPQQWQAQPPPENLDGQIFTHPDRPEIQIQGFAVPGESLQSGTNFVTNQGIKGVLTPTVETTTSRLTLRIYSNQVYYVWEGRSPSSEFAQYYPLFEQIAREYTIPVRQITD